MNSSEDRSAPLCLWSDKISAKYGGDKPWMALKNRDQNLIINSDRKPTQWEKCSSNVGTSGSVKFCGQRHFGQVRTIKDKFDDIKMVKLPPKDWLRKGLTLLRKQGWIITAPIGWSNFQQLSNVTREALQLFGNKTWENQSFPLQR